MGKSEEEYENEIREINNEIYKPRGGDRDAERYALLTGKDSSTPRDVDRDARRYQLLTGKGRDMGATTDLSGGGAHHMAEMPGNPSWEKRNPNWRDDPRWEDHGAKYRDSRSQPEESRESSRPSAEDFVREYAKADDSEWRTDYEKLDRKYDPYRKYRPQDKIESRQEGKRGFGKDIEYGSDYWDKLGWKQGTDKGTPREAPVYTSPEEEEIIITPPDDTDPIFDSGVTDTGTVDGPVSEPDTSYSISDRVGDYIDSLGLTGKDAEETRANTLAVTDPTTAAAIARQQERTITERTDDWLQKIYTDAGLGQVDEEGGQYWKDDLARGQTRNQVTANIMKHKKPAPSPSPSPSPTVTITPSRSNPSPSPSPHPSPSPSVSQKADDWLQKAYTSAGLGTVDAGGRAYWQKDRSGGQTKEQVIANIMRHKK
tara:strand:+ start:1861 stop:3144 length:1284 start_codon:yes stop_codon:yes gene_type:complete